MLKSVLTSAFRNIVRNRWFSLINLVGLSITMSLGLLIILIVKSQYSFDTFHHDADRIYRIDTEAIRAEGGTERYASVPLAVATALNEEYAYCEDLVRLDRQLNANVTAGDATLPVSGLFADPSFLTVFNFPMAAGDAGRALTQDHTVVLTRATAERLFGKSDPLGKTMSLGGYGEFTVTGVLQPFPGATHFEFELLASMASVPVLEKDGIIDNTTLDWNNYYTGLAYIKLRDGITPQDVDAALATIFQKNYADVKYETRDKGYNFYVQPLSEITPGPIMSQTMGRGMPEVLLIFLGVLAGVVMLMACFNYTHLMIAKSLTRAREIGVRKIVGARRWQVFFQFVAEAMVVSVIALGFSYLALQLLKPAFMQLNLTESFSINLTEDYKVILLFVSFALIVGAIAGLLPAVYLSAFKPLKVLRSSGDIKVYSRVTFRKVLMVTQFTLSLVFILTISTIYRQVDFMINADYGFNQNNLVNIRLRGMPYDKLANQVRLMAGVERIAGVSPSLGTWEDAASDYRRNPGDEPFVMRDFSIEENYLKNLQVEFAAGMNFSAGLHNQIILNERALKSFNFDTPVDAVGQKIIRGDSTEMLIVGVVKDFHFRPLSYEIGPVAFVYNPVGVSIMNVQLSDNTHAKALMAQIEAIWKKMDTRPFEWIMMDQEIDRAYESSGFLDIMKILGYITIVAVTLACLGMLGMAMYVAETRVKEVGVRKVLGASSADVLVLLSRPFLIMVIIAVAAGVPLSYFLDSQFLSMFAYRVSITPLVVFYGVMFLVVLGLAVIGSQTLRAAVTNPVKSLRYE